ncbi:molybdopterin-dependent oxidoreductase [Mycobacterium shimoidei]|uniref:molybdopterin-dependent oxidoreductase n=1 Tax=Mycobacterium shimoidei TaxID=29313 RepID=UPI000848864B|nr:molybdopterin-dependent oxidoreductase [Mycobacterium shimoidei]MCV7257105.1 molybdopterin-dependent oxidoreductase [Mycobacterium shimoidei]ODR09968.1 molybdopterin-binding protein [Mycobacterium shimoidei]ORW80616.1 molybdopterin-binding protein [Mycobacterium shimoidei]
MSIVNKGFRGRRTESALELPPGQHLTTDFPVLQTGPTPRINLDDWRFTIRDERGGVHAWTWTQLMSLPSEQVNVDIHCVTTWSKLDTEWEGVALDTLFESTDTTAEFALVGSYGGYTTNLPMRDLLGGRAWIVYAYDGAPLRPVHGGPARLLVPHLYFWKSAKWVKSIELRDSDIPGFWEGLGYHSYGDPWREQRYAGD